MGELLTVHGTVAIRVAKYGTCARRYWTDNGVGQ
jgi:hypothetical protein